MMGVNPIEAALRGENPMVMLRMSSGFAVIGESQLLPGYSLLLVDDPLIDQPTDLPRRKRRDFFFDLALLGEAVLNITREDGAVRVNYAVAGNAWAHLHGHATPRYSWEPPELAVGPIWGYPKEVRNAAEHAYSDSRHGALRARITDELRRITAEAYTDLDIA
jgi:diadenosine tetraphosphate (Ap4A) HIT family hydrolase